MPRFAYVVLDARGVEKTGLLDAVDSKQAAAALREQGLFSIKVTVAHAGPKETWNERREMRMELRLPFIRPVAARELAVFTRQLATMLRAGMPLLRGLDVLARQERNPGFRRVIEALGAGIKSGGTLSAAMARHAEVFDRLYINMIRAGEAGGALDAVLDRLARFQEKSIELRGKITAAMTYPLVVMSVAIAILAGLLVFVVPKFQQIFADLLKGAPLPTLTQTVLTMSDLVRNHLAATIAVAAALGIAFKVFRRTSVGCRVVDSTVLRLPMFGPLILKAVIGRFGRTFGTLLSSGVPILPALLITRDTCANRRLADAITEVHDRVKEGASVAGPLEATGIFPPMATGMIEVGEHTGQLPEMLGQVADIYEAEVDNAVAGLSSLIEPILILFLALVVGTIVIALFLPIVRIVQLLT